MQAFCSWHAFKILVEIAISLRRSSDARINPRSTTLIEIGLWEERLAQARATFTKHLDFDAVKVKLSDFIYSKQSNKQDMVSFQTPRSNITFLKVL
jgi:hypothetical protein